MTKQEVFNIVVKHLAAQNWEKSLANELCAYRGQGGKKCAIGALLNDDDVVHEGDTVFGRWFDPILERLDLGIGGREFLDCLQCSHDLASSGHPMQVKLKDAALAFRLEWPL